MVQTMDEQLMDSVQLIATYRSSLPYHGPIHVVRPLGCRSGIDYFLHIHMVSTEVCAAD